MSTMLTGALAGRLIEVYRKPAVGSVHTNLSSGSMCCLFHPGNRVRLLHDHDTRRDKSRTHACSPFSQRRTTLMNKHNRALALAEATTSKPDSEQRDIFGEHVLHI